MAAKISKLSSFRNYIQNKYFIYISDSQTKIKKKGKVRKRKGGR